ncbi:GPW/gp25 family protein [Amycolatopsis sp. RTGN1]|jgi:phage baseplate assembly protein W|uniref:GPW/gp25 family protein n=1 Tax=Amycolatopsis ponsaeliensis TaxID=2992142 RepID=UPI00254D23DB|nr:GPW/gp25 family protein [Amycolatopsis sp. RTGN1]
MVTGFEFPFGVDVTGSIRPVDDDAVQLRGKVLQVLFTAQGERVNRPDFGCGLFNLVFDPDNAIMAAAVEFSIGQALTRWLGDELAVAGVDVSSADEALTVEVSYVRRKDLAPQALRVHFR